MSPGTDTDFSGTYTYPRSSSALIIDQVPPIPAFVQEPSRYVSLPNSPGRGTTWNVHNCFPVRTSNPRRSPGPVRPSFEGWPPTTLTSPTTIGWKPHGTFVAGKS